MISYAKHMTHHVLPSVDLAAFAPFRHAFLIRDPRSLLASYARVRSAPTLADLGHALAHVQVAGPVSRRHAELDRQAPFGHFDAEHAPAIEYHLTAAIMT